MREKGRKLGLEMLKDADELWCFSEYISEGMAAEIQEASKAFHTGSDVLRDCRASEKSAGGLHRRAGASQTERITNGRKDDQKKTKERT